MVTMNRADTFTAGAEIALRDLAVRAGELPLLSGIDLDLESRGFVGLVGPMGSGKSTLLKFLCGWTARQGLAADLEGDVPQEKDRGQGEKIGQSPEALVKKDVRG